MATRTGQCLCGAVRFDAQDVDDNFGACHCEMCQRWSGGLFITTSSDKVLFQGDEHLTRYRSSAWAERGFCNVCGSNLFYRLLNRESYEMCVGSFDDKTDFILTSEIFIDRKPDGFALQGEHDRLTEAETLEKYKEFSG